MILFPIPVLLPLMIFIPVLVLGLLLCHLLIFDIVWALILILFLVLGLILVLTWILIFVPVPVLLLLLLILVPVNVFDLLLDHFPFFDMVRALDLIVFIGLGPFLFLA